MCSIAHATLVYILDVKQKRVFENMYVTSIGDHLWMDAKPHMDKNNSNLVIAMESLQQKIKHLSNCSTLLKRKPLVQMVTTHNPTRKSKFIKWKHNVIYTLLFIW
jgi:hypothetical protein